MAQHQAILALAALIPLPDLFDALEHADDAVHLASDLLAKGEAERTAQVLVACPALGRVPFHGPALIAVALAIADRLDDARTLLEEAISQGLEPQRAALVSRLQRAATVRPQLADPIGVLITILEPDQDELE